MPREDSALSLNDSCFTLELDVQCKAVGKTLFVTVDQISLVDLCLINLLSKHK